MSLTLIWRLMQYPSTLDNQLVKILKSNKCAVRSYHELPPIDQMMFLFGGNLGVFNYQHDRDGVFIYDQLDGMDNYIVAHEFGHVTSYRLKHDCHVMLEDGRHHRLMHHEWQKLAMQEEFRADTFAIELCMRLGLDVPSIAYERIEQLKGMITLQLMDEALSDVHNMLSFIKE